MTINPEAYQAITPYGPVQVLFPDDGGVEYDGPGAAVAYLQALISEQSGEDGRMLSPDSIDPLDLLNFCQPVGGRVQILPPLEEAMGMPKPAMKTTPAGATMDAVAPSLQDLRDRLKAAEGIKAKLAVMGEIVTDLAAGIKAGGDADTEFGLRARGKKTREKLNAQVAAITEQLRAGHHWRPPAL